jgi:hypothetical protein
MKKIILIVLISQAFNLFAQKISVKVGGSINYSAKIISIPNVGINYEYKLGKKTTLNTALNVISRGYSPIVQYLDDNGQALGNELETLNQVFIEIPIQVKFYIGKEAEKNKGLSLNLGSYLSYAIKRSIVLQGNINYSNFVAGGANKEQLQDSFDGNTIGASKIDFGVNIGASYSFIKIPVFFDLRFYQGFTDQEVGGFIFYNTFQTTYPFGGAISKPNFKAIQGLEFAVGYKF